LCFDFSKEPGRKVLDKYEIDGNAPLLSIVTPFYNSGEFFEATFRSVVNQTFPYFEWIIVNDGSTSNDDIETLYKITALDKRIHLFHKENGGVCSARNYGINKVSTDLILPLDPDDLIEPSFIETLYFALKCNPEASWAYTDLIGFQGQEYIWKREFSSNVMKKENILVCTALIRKKDILEAGGYAELKKHYNEDWRLWLKMLSLGKYPVHINQYGFWYRRTDNGRLAKVTNDKTLKRQDEKIIQEAAKDVSNGIKAIEFSGRKAKVFQKPYRWKWDRKLKYKSRKTKILMLIPYMEMGGADLFNLDLVSRLDKGKFEIGVITTVSVQSTWRQRFSEHVSDLFELPTFLNVDDWSAFIHYFIKSRSIDLVIISNSYYGYYISPWIRKEFPKVAIIDYVHMEEWYWRAGGYARTSAAVGDIIEKTYVCNEHLRETMIENFSKMPEAVETIYIGVDEEYYASESIVKGNVRKKFKINEDRPVILFPCRIHPQKRPYLMLEIAKNVCNRIENICFLVVGDGQQLNEIKRKVIQENLGDTVFFAGRQDDLRPFYVDSDITLICSIKEGLALTSYESLAMGVPVISSDVGGQHELIDNEVGRLIPITQDEIIDFNTKEIDQKETDAYVEAIVDILNDKMKYLMMCRACRSRIIKSFTKTNMIAKMEAELSEIVNGRGAEKRSEIARAVTLLENLVDDYLTIYNEYEENRLLYTKMQMVYQYLKNIILFKKSPLRILADIYSRKDHYIVAEYIKKFKIDKIYKLFRMD
jgi:glycosyltransferase involved in cell wall biosynthesis